MPTHLSPNDLLQDLLLLENMRIDQGQQQLIERLRHHVRALWRHMQRIESVLSSTQDEVLLQVGDASLHMKKDGTILIQGRDVTIKASGRIEVNWRTEVRHLGATILAPTRALPEGYIPTESER